MILLSGIFIMVFIWGILKLDDRLAEIVKMLKELNK